MIRSDAVARSMTTALPAHSNYAWRVVWSSRSLVVSFAGWGMSAVIGCSGSSRDFFDGVGARSGGTGALSGNAGAGGTVPQPSGGSAGYGASPIGGESGSPTLPRGGSAGSNEAGDAGAGGGGEAGAAHAAGGSTARGGHGGVGNGGEGNTGLGGDAGAGGSSGADAGEAGRANGEAGDGGRASGTGGDGAASGDGGSSGGGDGGTHAGGRNGAGGTPEGGASGAADTGAGAAGRENGGEGGRPDVCDHDDDERCDGVDNDCNDGADEGGVCPASCRGFELDGHAYMFCTAARGHFASAQVCDGAGMDLVRIDSASENARVLAAIRRLSGDSPPGSVHLGATDFGWLNEGNFRWPGGAVFWVGAASGSPVGGAYVNWDQGEPNDYETNEDCVEMLVAALAEKAGLWNDVRCSSSLSFVCEE